MTWEDPVVRRRAVSLVPMEVPLRIKRVEGWVNVNLHECADADLEYLTSTQSAVTGWVWARALARRLAGITPEGA